MSFYGNISNAGKTQMSFDRVYPNRKIMEENAPTDGVFVGRFVLIEYDDNTYSNRTGYINYVPDYDSELNGSYYVYTNLECTIPFKPVESNDTGYGLIQGDLIIVEYENSYYYFQYNGKTDPLNGNAYFNYITSSTESFNDGLSDYIINYNEDKKYAKKQNYPFTIGWDSTVWRKAFKNGKEQYQMIASLNSVTPKFTLTADAPTIIPTAPHFGINSTNINYDLHYQPNWGLRVKRAADDEKSDTKIDLPYKAYDYESESLIEEESYRGAIYFNKAGFNPKIRNHDKTVEDEVTVLPNGNTGQDYIVHNENGSLEKVIKEDTQEITLNLPSIGNIMSDVWDIVYGPINPDHPDDPDNRLRDMDLSWENNLSKNHLVLEAGENGYTYNPDRINTIAGSINSVHDLMGRIIVNDPPPNGTVESAKADKIYYGEYNSDISDSKGFYFKDKTYELQSFEEAGIDPDEYVGKRHYYDLTQFLPNTYYTYSNRNFYLDKSTVPQDTDYYKLGDPIKVQLKQWQPDITEIDPDTGKEIITKQYSYYKNEYLDYIKDKSKWPDQNKTYYQITTTKVTNPKHKDENDNSEIIKFFWPTGQYSTQADFDINNIDEETRERLKLNKVKKGYFYIKINEDGTKTLSSVSNLKEEDYNSEAEYFYLNKYAVSEPVGDDNNNKSEVAYIMYPETASDGLTTYKVGEDFYSLLNGVKSEINYNLYLKPNKIEMIQFEDNKYYYEIKDEINEGYKCIHNLDQKIVDEEICYTIEAIYDAGIINSPSNPDMPPNDEEEENNPEEIFFYKPNLYFIKDRNNYLLSKLPNMSLNTEYYLLTDKNNKLLELNPNGPAGTLLVTPENKRNKDDDGIIFYEPGKYYYKSSEFLTDILDNNIIMKTAAEPNGAIVNPENGRIYYTLQEAYVVEDTAGILEAGSVWDKEVAPPDTVTLGIRTETYKWTELKGFAEQLNTIHGLILEINKFLKFNDTLTRDRTTVQGCINQINDIINVFGKINPSDTVIINSYGQFAGARYITDDWISVSTDKSLSNPSITINHIGPTDSTTQIGETTAKTLKFGDSFKSYNFGIDEKGHINNTKTNSVDITMPSLSIASGTTGNVLTSLEVSADGQSIVANSSDIGTLTLASYAIQGDSKLAVNDSINDAFGKLQGQIDALDFADTNANTTQFISKITQTDGKISVERHNAGDLVLTGYSVATAKTAITTADTINSAFGKVEYRLDILQADSTQEGSVAYQIAQIVNENNNGSIDTLNEIAAWIVNDETGVAKMNKDISDLKTDVSGLKEQVQTATTGLLDRTTSLETLVGEKAVSAQINEALFVNDEAIYALASDLSNSNQRIEELENNVDTWNAAEANVQSDWNESDTTSDAYILNKPDLTNIVETTSQFDYTVGDTTNQLTIAQLVAKVAELEATIQTLTAST